MKILLISDQPTHPVIAGNRRFIVSQAEYFQAMKHEVYFLYVDTIYSSKKDIELMKEYWKDRLFLYKANTFHCIKRRLDPYMRKFLHQYIYSCDYIYPRGVSSYVNHINKKHKFEACVTNYYWMTKLFDDVKFPLMAVNSHDYFAYKNLHTGTQNAWMLTTAHEEAKAYQRCSHIFALNTEEAIYFGKLSPNSTVYNIFSLYDYKKTDVVGNRNILFLSGPNEYNINGLKWFINDIFPSIIKKTPDVCLIIGGGICKVLQEYSDQANIKLYGYVESAEEFYALGDVVINPTYQGTGLKIKTFESVSFDKITMVHPHSMIGIYRSDNTPIFSSINAIEWTDYLYDLWYIDGCIDIIKQKNMLYMEDMQKFIHSEYDRFFNSIH